MDSPARAGASGAPIFQHLHVLRLPGLLLYAAPDLYWSLHLQLNVPLDPVFWFKDTVTSVFRSAQNAFARDLPDLVRTACQWRSRWVHLGMTVRC